MPTPIQNLDEYLGNELYMKREDLFPYCFGGNKARKALLFFEEIKKGKYNCVVTYGSGSSNHVRVVSNLCASMNIECHVIAPKEAYKVTNNSKMRELFGADVKVVPVDDVHDTIEKMIEDLESQGKKVYFIPGGGHGNIGTQAYVDCYEEIKQYEKENGVFFDYIFFASGTGTTHAGLVVGKLKNNDDRKIIGISIARPNPRGRNAVLDSVREYMGDVPDIDDATIFVDDFRGVGYGDTVSEWVIKDVLIRYGIPLDETYTGKAFYGMSEYIKDKQIKGKKILFIHTGGTPLFFDSLNGLLYGDYN
ncbi:MAG: pyridoxal-phosphate dependent enzyme [Lachnospiraceae bacterium]|nr:pyridoxal-phosphate dependent enzyme [Lachnospiraceae bacterium]